MLRSLLHDLAAIPELTTVTTRDRRLEPLNEITETIWIEDVPGFDQCWQACVDAADAVWIIAPETDRVLERMSAMVVASGKVLIGSSPEAIAITASKFDTSLALAASGLKVVPSFRSTLLPDGSGPWVVKPDDGAGCDDTHRFYSLAAVQEWLAQDQRKHTHIVQPYAAGVAASLSMLCRNGHAWLLSCNCQQVDLLDDTFCYHGSVLNGMAEHWSTFDSIAQQVAQAIPGLAGYVGVDLVLGDAGITVIEINPRLTTSYAGLALATGCNPARMVLDLFYNDAFELPRTMARNVVDITLDQ